MKFAIILISFFFSSDAFAQQKPLTKDFVDPYTYSSFFVIGQHNNNNILNATGFFVKVRSRMYFITNNHVVGGEYAQSEHLREQGTPLPKDSIPNFLSIRIYGQEYGTYLFYRLPLTASNKTSYIKFYEDINKEETLLDVVAIPVPFQDYLKLKGVPSFDSTSMSREISVYPASELFVVGFPKTFGLGSLYPVWKRGTVASDPDMLNSFWIDATTRQGMSGSPVYFRGTSVVEKGGIDNYATPITILVGIYNAQSNDDLELGRVVRLERLFEQLNLYAF